MNLKFLIKILLLFFTALIWTEWGGDAFAQIKRPKYKQRDRKESLYKAKVGDVFPDNEYQYKLTGWCWGPGLTYTLSPITHTKSFGDTLDVNFNPSGKIGLYLEGGRYRILLYSYLFRYLDYGIAYKWLRGAEEFSTGSSAGSGKFSDHFLQAHFNLNNVLNVTNSSFLQNTIGINADYAIIKSREAGFGTGETYPSGFVAGIHYKIGYGFKVNDRMMIIPSLETPVFILFPFEFPKSTAGYLNSRYRPLVFSVRFLFLRPTGVECPPVYTPDFPDGIIPEGQDEPTPVEEK